jgi:hypothetical protein
MVEQAPAASPPWSRRQAERDTWVRAWVPAEETRCMIALGTKEHMLRRERLHGGVYEASDLADVVSENSVAARTVSAAHTRRPEASASPLAPAYAHLAGARLSQGL